MFFSLDHRSRFSYYFILLSFVYYFCFRCRLFFSAKKVHFSGKKWTDKVYRWHTGYPGGLKERSAKEMMERRPEEVLKKAILGMLKRNNLRHQSIEPRLRIYVGPDHPHTAQLPPDTTTPLPRHPRAKSGDFHFGLRSYNSQTTIGGAGEKK